VAARPAAGALHRCVCGQALCRHGRHCLTTVSKLSLSAQQ
jgi:hypothetical protein